MISRKKLIDQLLKKNSKYWVIEIDDDNYILYDGSTFKELTNIQLTAFRDEIELKPVWSSVPNNYHSNKNDYKRLIEKWYKMPEVPLFLYIDTEADKLTEN